MSLGQASQPESSESALGERIVGGDREAAGAFFQAHASVVRDYCRALCPPEAVEDATLAACVDFIARVAAAPGVTEEDYDGLLRKAARATAAGHLELGDVQDETCRAMPELIAAERNGELLRDAQAFRRHLDGCEICRETAGRLAQADEAFARPTGAEAEALRAQREAAAQRWRLDPESAERAPGPDVAEPAPGPEVAAPETEVPPPPPGPAPEPEPAPEPAAAEPEPAPEPAAAPESAEPEPEAAAPEPAELEPEAAAPEPQPKTEQPSSPQTVTVRRRRGGLVEAATRAGRRLKP